MRIRTRLFLFGLLTVVLLMALSGAGCSSEREQNSGITMVQWTFGHSGDEVADSLVDFHEEDGHFVFTITNAYPGYYCQFTAEFENTGEEVIEVTAINIDVLNAPEGEISVTVDAPPTPLELGVGEPLVVVFTIYVNDNAAQKTTYQIKGSVDAHQVED